MITPEQNQAAQDALLLLLAKNLMKTTADSMLFNDLRDNIAIVEAFASQPVTAPAAGSKKTEPTNEPERKA